MRREAIDRLIAILESARQRKAMYFQPVGPATVIHWLHGLRTGASFVGLEWSPEHRHLVVERRGLEFRVAAWESEELERRGLSCACWLPFSTFLLAFLMPQSRLFCCRPAP
jgi:hypothetical protein